MSNYRPTATLIIEWYSRYSWVMVTETVYPLINCPENINGSRWRTMFVLHLQQKSSRVAAYQQQQQQDDDIRIAIGSRSFVESVLCGWSEGTGFKVPCTSAAASIHTQSIYHCHWTHYTVGRLCVQLAQCLLCAGLNAVSWLQSKIRNEHLDLLWILMFVFNLSPSTLLLVPQILKYSLAFT